MHNFTSIRSQAHPFSVSERSPDSDRAGSVRVHDAGGILPLPLERHQVTAEFRSIGHEFSQMLDDLQHGMLVNVLTVPDKLADAAEALAMSPDDADRSRPWSAVIDLYVAALRNGHEHVVAAATRYNATELGRSAAEAISRIEDASSLLLQVGTLDASAYENLTRAAQETRIAASQLNSKLSALLQTMESATERDEGG
jgi:hypothetical protein